jgi:hypothetical protein
MRMEKMTRPPNKAASIFNRRVLNTRLISGLDLK